MIVCFICSIIVAISPQNQILSFKNDFLEKKGGSERLQEKGDSLSFKKFSNEVTQPVDGILNQKKIPLVYFYTDIKEGEGGEELFERSQNRLKNVAEFQFSGSPWRPIIELINNSIDHAKESEEVDVKSEVVGNFMKISVRDEGVGMDGDEIKKYLLNPYFSSNSFLEDKQQEESMTGRFGIGFFSHLSLILKGQNNQAYSEVITRKGDISHKVTLSASSEYYIEGHVQHLKKRHRPKNSGTEVAIYLPLTELSIYCHLLESNQGNPQKQPSTKSEEVNEVEKQIEKTLQEYLSYREGVSIKFNEKKVNNHADRLMPISMSQGKARFNIFKHKKEKKRSLNESGKSTLTYLVNGTAISSQILNVYGDQHLVIDLPSQFPLSSDREKLGFESEEEQSYIREIGLSICDALLENKNIEMINFLEKQWIEWGILNEVVMKIQKFLENKENIQVKETILEVAHSKFYYESEKLSKDRWFIYLTKSLIPLQYKTLPKEEYGDKKEKGLKVVYVGKDSWRSRHPFKVVKEEDTYTVYVKDGYIDPVERSKVGIEAEVRHQKIMSILKEMGVDENIFSKKRAVLSDKKDQFYIPKQVLEVYEILVKKLFGRSQFRIICNARSTEKSEWKLYFREDHWPRDIEEDVDRSIDFQKVSKKLFELSTNEENELDNLLEPLMQKLLEDERGEELSILGESQVEENMSRRSLLANSKGEKQKEKFLKIAQERFLRLRNHVESLYPSLNEKKKMRLIQHLSQKYYPEGKIIVWSSDFLKIGETVHFYIVHKDQDLVNLRQAPFLMEVTELKKVENKKTHSLSERVDECIFFKWVENEKSQLEKSLSEEEWKEEYEKKCGDKIREKGTKEYQAKNKTIEYIQSFLDVFEENGSFAEVVYKVWSQELNKEGSQLEKSLSTKQFNFSLVSNRLKRFKGESIDYQMADRVSREDRKRRKLFVQYLQFNHQSLVDKQEGYSELRRGLITQCVDQHVLSYELMNQAGGFINQVQLKERPKDEWSMYLEQIHKGNFEWKAEILQWFYGEYRERMERLSRVSQQFMIDQFGFFVHYSVIFQKMSHTSIRENFFAGVYKVAKEYDKNPQLMESVRAQFNKGLFCEFVVSHLLNDQSHKETKWMTFMLNKGSTESASDFFAIGLHLLQSLNQDQEKGKVSDYIEREVLPSHKHLLWEDPEYLKSFQNGEQGKRALLSASRQESKRLFEDKERVNNSMQASATAIQITICPFESEVGSDQEYMVMIDDNGDGILPEHIYSLVVPDYSFGEGKIKEGQQKNFGKGAKSMWKEEGRELWVWTKVIREGKEEETTLAFIKNE